MGSSVLMKPNPLDSCHDTHTTTPPTPTTSPPVITSSGSATGTLGGSFSYGITATNSPTSYGIVTGALPPGLSLSTSTGAISGTPTVAGTWTITMGATNAGGTGTATLTIAIGISVASTTAAPPAPMSSGGSAPSAWFDGALALLCLVRVARKQRLAFR